MEIITGYQHGIPVETRAEGIASLIYLLRFWENNIPFIYVSY